MKKLITIWFVLTALMSGAQISYTHKAFKAYQENKLDIAKAYIDTAITVSGEVSSAQTWHIRGFVYKEIFKLQEAENHKSPAREESLKAFIKSSELDETGEFKTQNDKGIYYIATSFYNQSVLTQNPTQYLLSIELYERSKEVHRQRDPEFNSDKKDVEFYNALGSMLSETYDRNKVKYADYADLAIKYLQVSLKIELDNLTANQLIGVLYYNKGVDLILNLSPDASLDELIKVQDHCVELFLKSEPFLLQAHKKDPTNCEIMTGLKGVRFNLNDKEQVKLWDDKLRELGCPVDE
jgi:hypothetical protein